MSPERASVFIIEDDAEWRERERENLEEHGHSVVGEAEDFDQARQAIPAFKEKGVQVVTMDGNLTSGLFENEEAVLLTAEIREKAPEVKVVGMAGLDLKGVDTNVGKKNVGKLGETVTNL